MAQRVKSYGIITLGALIYALAFDAFVAPNRFAMGGLTGLAQIINALVPALPVGVLSFLMNVPLFLAGWKLIGGHLLVSSLYAMAVSSLAIDGISLVYVFPAMDPILAALYGGVVMGVGLGLVFSQGATTGGTDIIGKLLKLKFSWLPIGKLILVPDVVVLALAMLVFGQIETALYGAIALFASSKVTDVVLYGLNPAKMTLIISDQWREVADTLLAQDRGVTILRGWGAYTRAEKHVLLIAFQQREIVQVKRVVHQLDPKAFLIVCDAQDVLGEGFGDYQTEEI